MTHTSAPGTDTTSPNLVLAVLSTAAFMASLDVFIVNVAFPDIGHAFHGASLSNLSWVLNAYAILYAALLVPLGRLADRYGRRAGFLAGLALFVVGSAACAASNSLWLLVAFRGVQAIGAAALTPTSLGLLVAATPADRRVRAVRVWAAVGAVAAAGGPAVGGLLIEASWRLVFLVNVPVGLAALFLARRYVPDSRDPAAPRTPDFAGAGLLAVAVAALAFGLVKGPDWGWSSGRDISAFAVAAVAFGWFAWRVAHHETPVVEPALLRVRAFAWSNVTQLLFSVTFGAALLALILWMQDIWSYSPLRTGLALAPGPLMVPLFAAVGQRAARRGVPAGRIGSAGCAIFAAGILLVALSVGPHASYVAEVLPGWLVGGIGVGLAMPTILSSATTDLPPARSATGSAIVNMSRQVGTVLGVSILTAILGTATGYARAHADFQRGWLVLAGASLLAAWAGLGMTPKAAGRADAQAKEAGVCLR